MRDGRVPKLAKNYEKIQQQKIESQRRAEGWYEDPVPQPEKSKVGFREESTLHKKPLKIKASSFGKDIAAQQIRN